jgi:hypothetical protein
MQPPRPKATAITVAAIIAARTARLPDRVPTCCSVEYPSIIAGLVAAGGLPVNSEGIMAFSR